jgi:hypothetical protein
VETVVKTGNTVSVSGCRNRTEHRLSTAVFQRISEDSFSSQSGAIAETALDRQGETQVWWKQCVRESSCSWGVFIV